MSAVAAASIRSLSDEELVRRIRGGEKALFEGLMRRYNQRLFRLARAVVRDDAEAEDVLQEAYVRCYAHLGQLQDPHRARAALRDDLFQRIGTEAAAPFQFDGGRCDRIVAAVLDRL